MVENKTKIDYNNTNIMKLIEDIKKSSLKLASEYDENIKLEININPKVKSVKVNLIQCNL